MVERICNVLINWFLLLTQPIWCIPVNLLRFFIERDFLSFFVTGEYRLEINELTDED